MFNYRRAHHVTSTVNQGQQLDPCLSPQAMADFWCCLETHLNTCFVLQKGILGPCRTPTWWFWTICFDLTNHLFVGAVANLQDLLLASGAQEAIQRSIHLVAKNLVSNSLKLLLLGPQQGRLLQKNRGGTVRLVAIIEYSKVDVSIYIYHLFTSLFT